jgi:hypothetical protein
LWNTQECSVAAEKWKTVHRNVYENRTTQGFDEPNYNLYLASQNKHGVQQAKHILESPDSTVVILVRDPLARSASAFLDKCFGSNARRTKFAMHDVLLKEERLFHLERH